jgi:hypothetical protein
MESKKVDFTKESEALNELIFEAKVLQGIGRMTVHSWRKAGVLDDKRDPNASRKWSYFSPLDVIWIGILNEMKKLRLTYAEMIACKKVLFEMVTAEDSREYPALEYYTFLVMLYNQPIYIVIAYENGIDAIWMLDEKDYFSKLQTGEIEHHTALCLHKIVKLILDPVYKLPDFSATAGLTDQEAKALEIIRNRTFRSIKITKRDGEIDIIESTERIEDADEIVKLLTEGKYQNIEIKQINGKIASAHRTVRTHFKK